MRINLRPAIIVICASTLAIHLFDFTYTLLARIKIQLASKDPKTLLSLPINY
jgi:hypothetical protein